MSVVLTHAYYLCEDPTEQAVMKPYVPLGILSIAAYLDHHGISNSVVDTTFTNPERHLTLIADAKPRVIGIYCNLMTKPNVIRLIRRIRNLESLKNCRIVVGGPEVRHAIENFLHAGADAVVFGEGEQSMLELCRFYLEGTGQLELITGIGYMNNGVPEVNPERPLLADLDQLPQPARHKVDLQPYLQAWKARHGENAISVSTMRGCPYTCKWCSRAVYGQSYRRRSPGLVATELESLLATYQPDAFWFVDDVFTISHKWLQAFRDALAERKLKIRYECITRADRMNPEVIDLLKETGCFRVWIGAESGSQRILDAMDRRVNVDQVRDMIRLTRSRGLQAGTFIMIGYPGETDSDLQETLQHLKLSEPDQYTITITYPIRGTELFREVEPGITAMPDWETGTDRQIAFSKTYSNRYYHFAIRWIANEMKAHKLRKTNAFSTKRAWHRIKSAASRSMMQLERLRHPASSM